MPYALESPMIKLTGTLYIRSIAGRNGAFSVGKLVTEIGEFAVKDALLDQYDEGRYEGEFGVSRIYPSHYLAGTRMVIEVRATLTAMALSAIEDLPSEQRTTALPEPDPIDPIDVAVETQASLPPVARPAADSGAPITDTPPPLDPDSEDAALFGALWPLADTVKLDTTVDRAQFRRQKDRLKALGYRFQPLGQTWQRPMQ